MYSRRKIFKKLESFISENRGESYALLKRFPAQEKPLLLHSDVLDVVEGFTSTPEGKAVAASPLCDVLSAAQEIVIAHNSLFVAARANLASWHYLHFNIDDVSCALISVSDFLKAKEALVRPDANLDDGIVSINLESFESSFPHMKEAKSIGRGVEYMNRYLCTRLFSDQEQGLQRLVDFLQKHQFDGTKILLNDRVKGVADLRSCLRTALKLLKGVAKDATWDQVGKELQEMGFEAGWGREASRIISTMELLTDVLEAPEPNTLTSFLARIPMVFRIVILSPHGYFGQSNVLGKPDTGGQVVYILDQVRALEEEMGKFLYEQGLDVEPRIIVLTRLIPEAEGTTCNQRIEPIHGAKWAKILRVPFRKKSGEVIPHWISRFEIWPYLERFTIESESELISELGGKPDFIIGNYSDGNIVASLLSKRLGVTQCNIAHALEKTKYLLSDLYWESNEEQYHFSCQFTADLIAMNTADFIITSTYQEIAGTADSLGQYESYQSFTMPGLYRVEQGIDPFDPKFNIVSPGADPNIFFDFRDEKRRSNAVRKEAQGLIFGSPSEISRGEFADKEKPILFSMSRLDHIKNMTGIMSWYAQNEELRESVNLFLVGGELDPNLSDNDDERHQIEELHRLFDEYNLEQQVRWVRMQTEKTLVGELYRSIADTRGGFVQPALFEAFGLTVIEAMTSGLPVFATQYGGPLEIIEHGVSGFHINPNKGEAAAKIMRDFYAECAKNPEHWEKLSRGAQQRVEERYTWTRYAQRLMTLTGVYGFWKYISHIERQQTREYLDMFYSLMYRPLAEKLDGTG